MFPFLPSSPTHHHLQCPRTLLWRETLIWVLNFCLPMGKASASPLLGKDFLSGSRGALSPTCCPSQLSCPPSLACSNRAHLSKWRLLLLTTPSEATPCPEPQHLTIWTKQCSSQWPSVLSKLLLVSWVFVFFTASSKIPNSLRATVSHSLNRTPVQVTPGAQCFLTGCFGCGLGHGN